MDNSSSKDNRLEVSIFTSFIAEIKNKCIKHTHAVNLKNVMLLHASNIALKHGVNSLLVRNTLISNKQVSILGKEKRVSLFAYPIQYFVKILQSWHDFILRHQNLYEKLLFFMTETFKVAFLTDLWKLRSLIGYA